jgi:hypothetical protein
LKSEKHLNNSAYNVYVQQRAKTACTNRANLVVPVKSRRSAPKKTRHRRISKASIVQSVIRLEELVWKAAQERNASAFKKLVPSDAVMIFQSGIVPQPQYLATMHERTISRYEIRGIRGYMPNSTTVILFYEALRLGSEDGKAFPSNPVIESTTWIRRGKRWVAILNQETPIGEPQIPNQSISGN